MPKKALLFILIFGGYISLVSAQDTLPLVSVKNFSGKMILSWTNHYTQTLKSINIQRSYDSLKFFTTIGTVLNPANVQNGFSDPKPPYNKMFYRLFIVFESGDYIFSKSYKPVIDTSISVIIPVNNNSQTNSSTFVPSKFVYTSRENNVVINLPDFVKNKFSVKFYDEKDNYLFQIKNIPESFLTVEKLNFKHSGWFYFSLYDGEKLMEKHKFFIAKDSKL
jgi:hypothetical protein